MSTITSTSGAGLSGLLQSITGSNTTNANSSTGSTTSTSTLGDLLQQVGRHKHGKGSHGGFDKLANAVTSALQQASNGGSGSITTDPNATITNALAQIFKTGSLGGAPDAEGDSATPPSNNAALTSASTTATPGLPDSFVQTLKSFGVTPQQFQSDLAAALKGAQENGGVDTASVFKSFPVGSIVDSIG